MSAGGNQPPDTLFKDRSDVDELLRSIPVVGKGKMGYLDAAGNEYAVFVDETSDYTAIRTNSLDASLIVTPCPVASVSNGCFSLLEMS